MGYKYDKKYYATNNESEYEREQRNFCIMVEEQSIKSIEQEQLKDIRDCYTKNQRVYYKKLLKADTRKEIADLYCDDEDFGFDIKEDTEEFIQ